MMDLSFRWPHPRVSTPAGELSFRLHTFENVYGIDPASMTVTQLDGGGTRVDAPSLVWAGGQEVSAGSMSAEILPGPSGWTVSVTAEHADGVRSVGVTIHDLPTGPITGVREGELDVPEAGRILRYPNGWFDLSSPAFGIVGGAGVLGIRSLDTEPRVKTFAFVPHFSDTSVMDVDLLVEVDATEPTRRFTAPGWVIAPETAIDAVLAAHRAHVDASYEAVDWDSRTDVPQWMRDISLVMTLHGRHFTGRTFLDYAGMLDAITRVAEKIEGRRILAYLPGWEGRYYRWYGRYDADSALGGTEGFRALVEGAQALGVHVMPMYGANIASRDLPGFERWGEPGRLRSASGLVSAGSVDWDGSRHYDHGSGALVNPAYAPWRAHLVAEIAANHRDFGFDAVFLDITAMHSNDPNGNTTEGLRALINELHAAVPGLLIAGEAWFDAIGEIVPLVQTGHHDTVPVYHDLPDEDLFTRSNRSFGHVCLGDAAHGSSGTHEAGYVTAWRLPVRRGVIPTMSVIEDTLDAAPERIDQLIDDAREYARLYL